MVFTPNTTRVPLGDLDLPGATHTNATTTGNDSNSNSTGAAGGLRVVGPLLLQGSMGPDPRALDHPVLDLAQRASPLLRLSGAARLYVARLVSGTAFLATPALPCRTQCWQRWGGWRDEIRLRGEECTDDLGTAPACAQPCMPPCMRSSQAFHVPALPLALASPTPNATAGAPPPVATSAFPLTALAVHGDATTPTDAAPTAAWLELYNVVAVVPALDFLALLTLATDGDALLSVRGCMEGEVLRQAAALEPGIQVRAGTHARACSAHGSCLPHVRWSRSGGRGIELGFLSLHCAWRRVRGKRKRGARDVEGEAGWPAHERMARTIPTQVLKPAIITWDKLCLGTYTGWGANARILVLLPAQPVPDAVTQRCGPLRWPSSSPAAGNGTADQGSEGGGGGGGGGGASAALIAGCAVGGAAALGLAAAAALLWRARTR